MSKVELIIEERAADIGNFMVGRLLPFRKRRSVGPFVFMDHMGPALLSGSENVDVLPHPHIGLSTLTWLLQGALMHRDSLGSVQEITPGAVNWMTAGRGVVHSEQTPEYLRGVEKTFHGVQIWVALPKDLEETEPSFTHIPASALPVWEADEFSFKLIAGEAFGRESPVPVYSLLYFVEISSRKSARFTAVTPIPGEKALFILRGAVRVDGVRYASGRILVLDQDPYLSFDTEGDTTVYLFGGEPFPEERFIHWNFVSSERDRIEKAKTDWQEGRFPAIPEEI